MKKKFTEAQIVGAINKQENGIAVKDTTVKLVSARQHWGL